jgi:hypothetical protein
LVYKRSLLKSKTAFVTGKDPLPLVRADAFIAFILFFFKTRVGLLVEILEYLFI